MDSIQDAASRIAAALAPTAPAPSARWRWGTVDAVNNDGTVDVIIAGTTVEDVSVAANVHVAAGSRVRVAYLGTDAIVDASFSVDEYPLASLGGTGTNQFYAHNGCATLMSSGTTPSAQWGTASVCTIPAGFRPAMGLYFPVAKDGAAQSSTYLQIGTDGAVTIQNAGGTQSAATYRVTATWAYAGGASIQRAAGGEW